VFPDSQVMRNPSQIGSTNTNVMRLMILIMDESPGAFYVHCFAHQL
jgi:hypothetical protein